MKNLGEEGFLASCMVDGCGSNVVVTAVKKEKELANVKVGKSYRVVGIARLNKDNGKVTIYSNM